MCVRRGCCNGCRRARCSAAGTYLLPALRAARPRPGCVRGRPPPEAALLGVQTALFSPCPHAVFTARVCVLVPSPYKDSRRVGSGPSHTASSYRLQVQSRSGAVGVSAQRELGWDTFLTFSTRTSVFIGALFHLGKYVAHRPFLWTVAM